MNESPRLVWLLSTPACMGDPGGFGHCQLFFSHVHVIKLIFCLKKETHYAYGYPYVFLTFHAEEYG